MHWEKAKVLTIIIFLSVNVMLAILNGVQRQRHTVSFEQEQNIRAVFRDNNVSMYCKIVRNYPNMRILTVMGFQYDAGSLVAALFPDGAEIVSASWENREEYVWNDIVLIISNGYITYDNPYGFGAPPYPLQEGVGGFTKAAAEKACDAFVMRFFPEYMLDAAIALDDGWRLYYRQIYRKHTIHTNFVEFWITTNGIEQMDIQYAVPIGFSGQKQRICSPDEALLTFVQRIHGIRGDTSVIIRHMDIVYYQNEYGTAENPAMPAIPCYRIFIEGQEMPFIINAFTNQMI